MAERAQGFFVAVDVDKTVFSTNEFITDIAHELERAFGIDGAAFSKEVDSMHVVGQSGLRSYDFLEHVKRHGLDPTIVEAHIVEAFCNKEYGYDDVPPFIDFLEGEGLLSSSFLLTHGVESFQRMKYKCAPMLGRLAFASTLEAKGPYLSRTMAGAPGVIIDDKNIPHLPVGVRQIHIDRTGRRGVHVSFETILEQWYSELNV